MKNQEIITDFNNLYRAFKVSRNNRSYTAASMKYSLNAITNLRQLQEELKNKTYKVSGYTKFEVTVPKKRVIEACKFRDKIVQHILCDNILLDKLNEICIKENYAGQIGKGTLAARNGLVRHLEEFAFEHGTDGYIYRGDISKYYYSISHQEAKDIMEYHYPEDIHWLIDEFIDSTDGDCGIALGNQINTIVSNLYLDSFDKFIGEEVGIKCYARYADDFYLIHHDKEYLKRCSRYIEEYLKTLKLNLNPKSQIIPLRNGIPFLGFHFYIKENGVVIKLDNGKKRAYRRKFNRIFKKVQSGKMEFSKLEESYRSWKEHASYCTNRSIFNYYEKRMEELKCVLKTDIT